MTNAAQNSNLGSDQWNMNYNGVLELKIPVDAISSVFLVAYANDFVEIIIVRNTKLTQLKLNLLMRRASGWLDEYGLKKTEFVVLTRKWIDPLFLMTMLDENIMTKEAVNYLGITLDTNLIFFAHIKAVSDIAARITTVLSGLESNISGVRQSKKRLLMSVVHSIFLYGTEVWADALRFEFYR